MISVASKCLPLKSSLDRRFSFSAIALRIMGHLRFGGAHAARMLNEPQTPKLCDSPHDIHLDTALQQPACQPEPAPAGLVGDDHSVYRHASSGGAALVALDCCHERVGTGHELLLDPLVLETRHLGGDDPAAAADLDSEDQRAIVVEPIAGSEMGMLGHGSASRDGGALGYRGR